MLYYEYNRNGVRNMIRIELRSEVPIYLQLRKQIIAAIAAGELKSGESLPSVRKLASDLGINLHTVNKTYAILRDEGYVAMHRRKGVVVAEPPQKGAIDEVLIEKLLAVAAEARAKGIEESVFLSLCRDAYMGDDNT